MMNWKLNGLIGECKDAGRGCTYREISQATGLSTSILTTIAGNEVKRADLGTLNSLLGFFSKRLGRPLTTQDLLEFSLDAPSAELEPTPEPEAQPTSTTGLEPDLNVAIAAAMQAGPYPPGLAPLTAANLRKPLAALIDPGATAVDAKRMEELEQRRRALLAQAQQAKP